MLRTKSSGSIFTVHPPSHPISSVHPPSHLSDCCRKPPIPSHRFCPPIGRDDSAPAHAMTPPHESPLPPRSSLCAHPPSTTGPASPLPRLLCRTSALAAVPPRDSPPHRALADAVVVPPSASASPGTAPAGAAVVSPSVEAQPGTAPDGAGGSPFCRSRCGARHAGMRLSSPQAPSLSNVSFDLRRVRPSGFRAPSSLLCRHT